MKNPCNPVFTNETLYKQFRAKFANWLPSLKTLDGTDFKDDKELIEKTRSLEQSKRAKLKGNNLPVISEKHEEQQIKSGSSQKTKAEVDKTIKAQAGTTAFQYN